MEPGPPWCGGAEELLAGALGDPGSADTRCWGQFSTGAYACPTPPAAPHAPLAPFPPPAAAPAIPAARVALVAAPVAAALPACRTPLAAPHIPPAACPPLVVAAAIPAARAAAAAVPASATGPAAQGPGHAALAQWVVQLPCPDGGDVALRPPPCFYRGAGARPFVTRAHDRANLTSGITMSPRCRPAGRGLHDYRPAPPRDQHLATQTQYMLSHPERSHHRDSTQRRPQKAFRFLSNCAKCWSRLLESRWEQKIHHLVRIAEARNVQGTPMAQGGILPGYCTCSPACIATQNHSNGTVFLSIWPDMSPWGIFDLIDRYRRPQSQVSPH